MSKGWRLSKTILWIVFILLGFIQAWANRDTVYTDGISYLDIGERYFSGDWNGAINAYWSPLYSWILGFTLYVFNPSPYWEATVLHLVNFSLYIFALFCFDFLLKGLLALHRARSLELSREGRIAVPEWALLIIGYSIFLMSSLYFINLARPFPDICVSAFVYWIFGILIRIRGGTFSWSRAVLLGLLLGLSYLCKAVMFPLAFVFLGACIFLTGNIRLALPRVLMAAVIFLLVCSPFVIAISKAKGRLTFGEAGKLNYAWEVAGIKRWVHWQGEPPGSGAPQHPVRKVLDAPATYEFATPVSGSYPPWYDPSYWYEGVSPRLDPMALLKTFFLKGTYSLFWFIEMPGALPCLLTLPIMLVRGSLVDKNASSRWFSAYWFLLVPAFIALCVYCFVFVEQRYIAPFLLIMGLGLLATVHLPDTPQFRVWLNKVLPVASILTLLVVMTPQTFRETAIIARELLGQEGLRVSTAYRVYSELSRMGVRPGDKVGVIGGRVGHYWARLSKVKIVIEINGIFNRPNLNFDELRVDYTEVTNFWKADPSVKARVMQTFKDAGARAIIADHVPPWAATDGWQRVRGEAIDDVDPWKDDFYIYLLPE